MKCSRGHELVMDEVARIWVHEPPQECGLVPATDFTLLSDDQVIKLAQRDVGNCVHDAHLGLNTYDCVRCCARREARERGI